MLSTDSHNTSNSTAYDTATDDKLKELYIALQQKGSAAALSRAEEMIKEYSNEPNLYRFRCALLANLHDDSYQAAILDMYQKFPDNLFAQCEYANILIEDNRLLEISPIFNHKYDLKSLHPNKEIFYESEVKLFHVTMVKYLCALERFDQAIIHVKSLQEAFPDSDDCAMAITLFLTQLHQNNAKKLSQHINSGEIPSAFNHNLKCLPAMYAALANPEQYTVTLLECLEVLSSNKGFLFNFKKMQYVMSIYLLAALREQKTFDHLVKILHFQTEQLQAIFGDILTEDFHRFLLSTYNGNAAALFSIITNATTNSESKIVAIKTLVALVAQNYINIDDVINALGNYLVDAPNLDKNVLSWLVYSLTNLHAQSYASVMYQLCDSDLVYKNLIDTLEIERRLKLDKQQCLKAYVYKSSYHKPISSNLVKEVNWINYFDFLLPNRPYKLYTIAPGRNDLCACESGKKYKKCCMEKDSFFTQDAYNCIEPTPVAN